MMCEPSCHMVEMCFVKNDPHIVKMIINFSDA